MLHLSSLNAGRAAPLASLRPTLRSRKLVLARVSAPYENHSAIADLDSTFRNRNINKPIASPRAPATSSVLHAMLDCVQLACILTVLAIQLGLAIQKVQARRGEAQVAGPRKAIQEIAQPCQSACHHVAEFQPTFLVLALGAALASKILAPKERLHLEVSNSMGHRVLQNQAELDEVRNTLRTVDRKVTKVQSRVVLCVEQLKGLRQLTMGTRTVATETLTNHATTLADVTEQTNTLQHVVSALQDVVVKQIQVMAPPIKKLGARVSELEESVSVIREGSSTDESWGPSSSRGRADVSASASARAGAGASSQAEGTKPTPASLSAAPDVVRSTGTRGQLSATAGTLQLRRANAASQKGRQRSPPSWAGASHVGQRGKRSSVHPVLNAVPEATTTCLQYQRASAEACRCL